MKKKRLGDVLVERGTIQQADIDRAFGRAAGKKRTIASFRTCRYPKEKLALLFKEKPSN